MADNVAASTRNWALCAIDFPYKHILEKDVGELEELVWAKQPAKLPEVFTVDEVDNVLRNAEGVFQLMATLMHGAGLRLIEWFRLRIKDIDFT